MSEPDVYLETLAKMEPDIAAVDECAALASIAISLKRIADTIEKEPKTNTLNPTSYE